MKTGQRLFKGLGLVAAALAIGSPTAHAATFSLTPDGAWFDFLLIDGEPSWLDIEGAPASFTFTSSTSFSLRVVDYFMPGDSAAVYANGVLLGATPSVIPDDASFADTPDAALGNAAWSQGTWALGPGSYTFTGLPGDLPTGSAWMALSVTAVPEASSLAMLLAGLTSLPAIAHRRRQSRQLS